MLDKFKKNRVSETNGQILRPPVDIHETEKEVVLEVEVPGVEKDTLNVELHGNNLTIDAVKKKDPVEEKWTPVYQERHTEATYHREFELNAEVDRQNINASYQNGTLKITLVKSQEAQPQKISIAS